MTKKERFFKIYEVFNEVYPDADCSLAYSDPFELLVATQLAAQCTDARVNLVTPKLFHDFPDVRAFADADILSLEDAIRSTGFFHNKAKNLKACAQMLISDFGGKVPDNMDELLTLPGVGRKTANLLLGDIFGKPSIVVDTHAGRLARRFGFTKNTDPYKVELDLIKIIPPDDSTRFCHQLVLHGRAYCTARNPRCKACPIKDYCTFSS